MRKVRRIQVYSPNEEHRRRFAQEMQPVCGCDIEPVLPGHWVAQGTHINAVGSNFLGKAELDAAALRRCQIIVVDSKEQARLEAGDFQQALEDGSLHWADVRELGQVIVGRFPGRKHAQDVTLFKSLGIAIEDIAVAARVYARAVEAGIGTKVADW